MKQITVITKYSPTKGWEASSEQVPGCVACNFSALTAMSEFVTAYADFFETRTVAGWYTLGREPRAMFEDQTTDGSIPEGLIGKYTLERLVPTGDESHERFTFNFAMTEDNDEKVTWLLKVMRRNHHETPTNTRP